MAHDTSNPLFMYLPFQVTHSPYEIPSYGGYVSKSDPQPRQVTIIRIPAVILLQDSGCDFLQYIPAVDP